MKYLNISHFKESVKYDNGGIRISKQVNNFLKINNEFEMIILYLPIQEIYQEPL